MTNNDKDPLQFETMAVREGHYRTHEGEHSEPIFLTSSYVFDSAEQAAQRFSGESVGNIYSRFTNPTVRAFEERLAMLEGAERAIATASGMAAIASTFMGLLNAGDEVVASRDIFGTTLNFFEKHLSRFNIKTHFVPLTDLSAWEAAISPNTKALYLETPSNPLNHIADLMKLSELAKANNCLLIVDNCLCTAALQKPLEFGADIVIYSATKFIDGQGRCVGGAVLGTEQTMTPVFNFLRTAGTCMSPFNAWVFLKSLETLQLRMRAHSENALELAVWLAQHTKVEEVHYAGLASHPQHALAKQHQRAFGGVLSFEIAGNKNSAWKVIDGVNVLSITGNLGDAKSTITHPATTTHNKLSDAMKTAAGIKDNLIRISVGLENINDIKTDLDNSLKQL